MDSSKIAIPTLDIFEEVLLESLGNNMKKYEIRKNENTFEIVEKTTDLVIASYDRKYKSYDLLNKLNSGGGFDGWTPNFFIKNIKKSASSV